MLGLLSAIPAAVQAGTGIYQMFKGRQQRKSLDRPEFAIPQETLDKLTDAQVQSLVGLPEEQRQKMIQDIERGQQSALQQYSSMGAGLKGIAAAQQTATDAMLDVGTLDAQERIAAQQRLQDVRGEVSRLREKEFELNEMQPYLNKMRSAEAMSGAGLQNIMGGVTSGAKMGLDYAKYMKLLNSFGGDTSKTGGGSTASVLGGLFSLTDSQGPIGSAGIIDANKSFGSAMDKAASVLPKINF